MCGRGTVYWIQFIPLVEYLGLLNAARFGPHGVSGGTSHGRFLGCKKNKIR